MNAIDEKGNLDCTEFINVSKDDALAFPTPVHRTYPSTVTDRMDTAVIPFVKKSLEVNNSLLAILNEKLGLPQGTLAKLHREEERSGCVARVIRTPPKEGEFDEAKAVLSSHTDFGSLVRKTILKIQDMLIEIFQSFLHNRLGGLQVLAPGSEKWQYIKVTESWYAVRGTS